jgi:hypothetical protein
MIGALILAVIGVLSLWVWRATHQHPTKAAEGNDNASGVKMRSAAQTATPQVKADMQETKEQKMSATLKLLNHMPIVFYGKAVDQNGDPVAGTKVKGGVMVETTWMGGNTVDYFTETDGMGKFEFRSIKGRDISIWLSKEGYEFRQRGSNDKIFYYSRMWNEHERHHPDPANPVVFIMWKLKGAEPMNHSEGEYKIDLDGAPLVLDLLEHRLNKTRGDLVIRAKREPATLDSRNQKYGWQLALEAVDGGLVEYDANTPYPNEAPADGYQPSLTYGFDADDPGWQRNLERSFFFTTRNGKVYGRLRLRTILDRPSSKGVASLDIYFNPKGSRNLEYDQAKDIRNPWPPAQKQ